MNFALRQRAPPSKPLTYLVFHSVNWCFCETRQTCPLTFKLAPAGASFQVMRPCNPYPALPKILANFELPLPSTIINTLKRLKSGTVDARF